MPDGDVVGWSTDGVVRKTPDRIVWRGAGAITCFEITCDGLTNLVGHGPVEQAGSTLEPLMQILWEIDLRTHDHDPPPLCAVYTAYIIRR